MSTIRPSNALARMFERSFFREEIAFAQAWEVYAPGLGGWTVTQDEDDDGGEVLLVDPPLVFGEGFEVRLSAEGVLIASPLGQHRAPTLRDALLLICPLSPAALEAADALAAEPELDLALGRPSYRSAGDRADPHLDPVPDGDAQIGAVEPRDLL